MKPVFGFCGAAGAGKDTTASFLEDRGVMRYGFTAPLKALCSRIFGWDETQLVNLAYKEASSNHEPFTTSAVTRLAHELVLDQFGDKVGTDPHFVHEVSKLLYRVFMEIKPDWTRRQILQQVGTNAFRLIDENHWANKCVESVQRLLRSAHVQGVSLPDLRFVNEAEAIRRVFPVAGRIIRVERIGGPTGTTSSAHVSEQEWQDIFPDYTFAAQFGDSARLKEQMYAAWADVMLGEEA